jgi:hypothetical protein
MTNFPYNIHCQYYTNGKAIMLNFQKEIGKVYVIEGNKRNFIFIVQLQHTHPIAISNKNGNNKLQSSTFHMLFILVNLLLKLC